MKRTLLHLVIALALGTLVRADSTIQSVQQVLKNQKVYYGKITGEKNAETTAAIRRYQIRSGLQVTGEVNSDTLRSLNINPNSVPPTSKPSVAQSTTIRGDDTAKFARNFSKIDRTDQSAKLDQNSTLPSSTEPDRQFDVDSGYAAAYYKPARTRMNKRVLVAEVQRQLTTGGYYRGSVDGRLGRETILALRTFQLSSGLPSTGHLDATTLNAIGVSDQNLVSADSAPRASETWMPVTKYKHGKWKVKWKKYQRDEGGEYGDADHDENGRAWWNAVGQDE